MIKFFRKIRQNLLSENKFSKYLIYAVGEIVLVVIGILIALSINNKNEERKLRDNEQALLLQLKQEFESNLNQLNQKIEMREIMINSAQKLLKMIDDKNQMIPDSIGHYLSFTRMNPTFDPIRNDLTVGDKLSLIENVELKKMLTQWESNEEQLEESERRWLYSLNTYFRPLLYEHNLARELFEINYQSGSMSLMSLTKSVDAVTINKSIDTDKFVNFMNDPRLESHLAWTVGINTFGNVESNTLKNHIIDILKQIDKDIKQ
ncbi:DUF6090 family protein [Hanstruepera marina]|uniref:DUF6090 family protein n=1 Tax=Hanstruepera marina TaxID=2873265 RepID=UPI001CA70714|nr:DUF6090 family protein [Hanstruepera marina]